jgi:hypothetical protein
MRRVLFGAAALLVGLALLVVPAQGDPEYDPASDMDLRYLYLPIISSPARNPPAPVPKTGQTESRATGDDGDLQKGVAWPDPRFTDNGDGTVTDNLTGLIWLQNANCFGVDSWSTALDDANALNSGECGLSDGSSEGDWRLPNVRELQSLLHYGVHDPAVPNTVGTGQWSEGDPFIGVQSDYYWSSTTFTTTDAWRVYLGNGYVNGSYKPSDNCVWPVRGGQ